MNTNEFLGMFVGAMATVIGIGAVIVKPLINNAKVMTELNESIKALTSKFNTFEVNNHDDHKRIWSHNDEQDDLLNKHETRISLLENEVGKK